jgi:hypothetical protein
MVIRYLAAWMAILGLSIVSLLPKMECYLRAVVSNFLSAHKTVLNSRKISLGDDEAVRIWDIEALSTIQVIRDPSGNWGQITCLNWLAGEERNTLCFGTGRGFIALFQASESSVSHRLSCTTSRCMKHPSDGNDRSVKYSGI